MSSRPLPVKVRLMGQPDDVARVADRIEADLTVIDRSEPYPNRGSRGQVRVYLEAAPHDDQ